MSKLPIELTSGIEEIDNLTKLIHSKSTSKKYIKYLFELRDEKINNLRNKESYFHKFWEYQFKLGKYDSTPIIKLGLEKFEIKPGYVLELGSVEHVSFPKIGYFIYINNNGNIILPEKDNYYKSRIIDENNNFVNENKYRYIYRDIPMSETTYGWYHVSSLYKIFPPPQSKFEYIKDNWIEKSHTYHTCSNGQQCLWNTFYQIKSQLQ